MSNYYCYCFCVLGLYLCSFHTLTLMQMASSFLWALLFPMSMSLQQISILPVISWMYPLKQPQIFLSCSKCHTNTYPVTQGRTPGVTHGTSPSSHFTYSEVTLILHLQHLNSVFFVLTGSSLVWIIINCFNYFNNFQTDLLVFGYSKACPNILGLLNEFFYLDHVFVLLLWFLQTSKKLFLPM